jgi:hypothetical protein
MRNESDPYAPPLTRDEPQTTKRLSRNAWVLAYLISVAAPFVCLRIERAISTFQCILGILAALLVQVGMVSILGRTEGNPLQPFLLVLFMMALYLIVLWQYRAGHATALWSEDAERQWRTAGRFFAGFIGVGLAVSMIFSLMLG